MAIRGVGSPVDNVLCVTMSCVWTMSCPGVAGPLYICTFVHFVHLSLVPICPTPVWCLGGGMVDIQQTHHQHYSYHEESVYALRHNLAVHSYYYNVTRVALSAALVPSRCVVAPDEAGRPQIKGPRPK